MSTSTPKNYITTGISKTLLTPCRRVGLSRSKKKPKNDNASPLTLTPNKASITPVKKLEITTHEKENNLVLIETPKGNVEPTKLADTSVLRSTSKKTKTKSEKEKPSKSNNFLDNLTEPDKVILQNKNESISSVKTSPSQDVETKTMVPVKKVEITHAKEKNLVLVETPKRNVPTKLADTSVVRSTSKKTKTKSEKEKPDKSNSLLDNFTESDKVISQRTKNESSVKKSPTQDIARKSIVTVVEVHHPVAKRNINFNTPNNSPVVNNSSPFPIVDEKYTIDTTEKTTAVTREKKRRISIDSDDDFTENKNIIKSKNSTQNSFIHKNMKKSRVLSNNSSGITLARFTTDDYLKEYTNNPKMFQENLEKESSVTATTNDVYTNETKSYVNSLCNTPKENNEEKKNVKSPIIPKKYVAILYPINDNSKKVQRSLSLKKITNNHNSQQKSTEEQDIVAEDNISIIIPKSKLTVSLERLKTDNLKSKQNKSDISDIQLKKTPLNVSPVNCLKYSKLNIDDDDEELFTSSPEDDKKQRENLLKLIADMEIEIKQKEERLEKLRQAEVYKKKHSPEKVKISSDRWLNGCRTGLDDLLAKMQEHGPMEMDTLVKKLGIPDNILKGLGINS